MEEKKTIKTKISESLDHTKKSLKQTGQNVVQHVSDSAVNAKNTMVDTTINVKDKIVDHTIKTKDKVIDGSIKAKDKVVDSTINAKDKVVDSTINAKDNTIAALARNRDQAKELLRDKEKIEHFLMRLERKLKKFPGVGKELSYIPAMMCLVKDYVDGEYTDIPLGSIIGIVSALIYFISPFNIIPNAIPILGISDDIALIAYVWRLVGDDVTEYEAWRKATHKELL